MLANLGTAEAERHQVGEAFGHFLANEAAAEALVKTAFTPNPSPGALRDRFIATGLTPDTLGTYVVRNYWH